MSGKRGTAWKRRGCLGVLGAVGVLLLLAVVLKFRWDASYYDGYDASLPLNAEVVATELLPEYRRDAFVFDGVRDKPVPGVLALPTAGGPFPCLIFLHGIGQDKGYLDKIAPRFVEVGFAMATFDQYTRGERRLPQDANPVKQALALRRRGALTVIETRRLVDYLQTREEIDSDGIYLLGASFGAMTGCTVAAFEPRLRGVVLTYGGGDLDLLLHNEQARQALGRWTPMAARVAAFLMAPADPVRHVAGIAPRPLLFQNGRHDTLIPVAAAQALYDAAQEPKEITWYESDHIGLDEAHVDRVLEDTISWLEQQEARRRGR